MRTENLINYQYLLEKIEKLSDEYAKIFTDATKTTSGSSDNPQPTNRETSQKVENYAIKLLEVREKLETALHEKRQVEKSLGLVSYRSRFLLEEHYIKGKTLKKISKESRKSYKYVISLKTKALEELRKTEE